MGGKRMGGIQQGIAVCRLLRSTNATSADVQDGTWRNYKKCLLGSVASSPKRDICKFTRSADVE